MPSPLLLVAGVVVGALVGALVAYLWVGNRNRERDLVSNAEREKLLSDAETQMKEMVLEAKEEAHRIRLSLEQEVRDARAELQRSERRVQQKEESIDRKLEDLDRKEQGITQKELEIGRTRERVNEAVAEKVKELERSSGMTRAEARTTILTNLEKELSQEMAQKIREGEEVVKEESEKRARNILVTAMQRVAAEQTAETSVSVVALPNDEMKGRIIGREGRNIRALEAATGVDLIIDDTPEAVILSGFDPVRREVARVALTKLILDGRIHPARIEEVVAKARQEVDAIVREAGERAALEANVHGLQPELLKIIGRLHFRTSYGQNVLAHSVEVSILAATIAHELGADVNVCKTAALLHDMGKAIDQEVEGPHAIIGGEIARRFSKSPKIIHAMVAHHATESEPQSLEAAIVQAADAISAARPGARRETIDLYIKRLEALESIANSFTGVEKSFAIQAGREVRIIVKPEEIDEYAASRLASDIAHKIEENLDYPGQIKVCVVRETRSVDYAR